MVEEHIRVVATAQPLPPKRYEEEPLMHVGSRPSAGSGGKDVRQQASYTEKDNGEGSAAGRVASTLSVHYNRQDSWKGAMTYSSGDTEEGEADILPLDKFRVNAKQYPLV